MKQVIQNIFKRIVIYLMIITGQSLHAQNPAISYTLNSEETASKTYTARDEVKMLPGFSFSAGGGNTFSAKIDAGILFLPTSQTYKKADGTFTNDPTQGVMVGSLPGNFAVSSSGAATYTIPINVTPGINGMQPNISLVYNSQAGIGSLGAGWDIAGISTINKTVFNIFSDNKVSGIENENKVYLLDGQRLVEKDVINVNSTYSAPNQDDQFASMVTGLVGSTYETLNKDYSQIESFGIAGYISGEVNGVTTINYDGPGSFKVTSKSGVVCEYFVSNDVYTEIDSHPLTWYLSKITDTNGNFVLYNYETDEGQTMLKNIVYTGNGITQPLDSLLFKYVSKEVDYTFIGSSVKASKFLLSEIILKSNNVLVKKYKISYTTNNNRYFVNNIQLSGSDNSLLNATSFNWGLNDQEISVNTKSVPALSQFQSVNNKSKHWLSADVNADGLDDVISVFPNTETVNGVTQTKNYLQISKAIITNGQTSFLNDSLYEITADFSYSDIKSHNPSIQFADLYGTNAENIIIPQLVQSSNNKIARFNIIGIGSVENILLAGTQMPCYSMGDVNNDGKEEIIYIEKSLYNEYYPCKIGYNVNGQTIWEETTLNLSGTEVPKSIIVKDYNNDGLNDFVVLTNNGYKIFKNNGGVLQTNGVVKALFVNKQSASTYIKADCDMIKTGDFNGDNLTDFIVKQKSSTWVLAVNNGKWDFISNTSISLGINASVSDGITSVLHQNQTDCIVLDFDNDGTSDIVMSDNFYTYSASPILVDGDVISHYQYDGTDIIWYRSTKENFEEYSYIRTTDTNLDYNQFFNMLGDFDGDGRSDVLVYGRDIKNGINKSNHFYLHSSFNQNFNSGLMTSVINGMGNTIQFNYQPITYTTTPDNKPFYTKGAASSYPLCKVQWPIYCVSKVLTPNGQGQWLTTEHSYSEALIQLTGIGYLGFKSNTQTDAAFNRKVVTTNTMNTANYLPNEIIKEVFTLNNSPIYMSKTEFAHSQSGKIIETKQTKTTNKDFLTGLEQTTEYLIYDLYGNPGSIKITRGNIITLQTVNYIQSGSHCPNKPGTITVNTTKGTESYSRTKSFTYDIKGNLTSVIADTGNVNQLTVQYEQFNAFGQPTQFKTIANGITRTTSLSMSNSKKRVQSKTNVMGQTTYYNWNENLGVLNSEISRLGETKYTYNGFGQVANIRYPNGVQSAQTLQWAAPGNSFNAVYFKQSQTSGTSPVTIWYDALGREIVKEVIGLNDNTSRVFTEYDALGRVYRISEPTFAVYPENWAVTYSEYDTYGRIKTITSTAGQTIMSYNGLSTTVTTPDGSKQTIINTAGEVETTTINGKSVSYTYYPSGLLKATTPQNGQAVSMNYDLQGNRTILKDPDLGLIRAEYNGFGELLLEKQLVHNNSDSLSTIYEYDSATGMLLSMVRDTETTYYDYDELKRLSTVEIDGINGFHKQTLTYNDFDQITNLMEEIDDRVFNKQVEYDFFGRVRKEIFPSGYSVTNSYDQYSNLTEVKDAVRTIYKPIGANARGQLTQLQKGNITTTFGYNDLGLTKTIVAPGVVSMEYSFDSKSNIEYRIDHITNQREDFVYDGLNRLTNWNVMRNNITTNHGLTYNAAGNIESKTDFGAYTLSYGEGISKPHALTSVSGVPTNFPTLSLIAEYTDFKKLKSLSQDNKYYEITYGVDEQRRKSVYQESGVTKLTRFYLGNYEEEITATNIRKIHYLSGAIYIDNSNSGDSLYFVYTDNQGSVIALTDETGNVKRRYAYDPWGDRRNPDNWNEKDTAGNLIINRGYTGHEHMDAFSIINMSGRVYDPVTAQFLSPDPFLQSPEQWLNYNRYSYVMNNPMLFTDPSGYRHKTAQELEIDAMWQAYSPEAYWEGRYRFHPDRGLLGWAPAGSRGGVMGSITWDYEDRQYEYGNGAEASDGDIAELFDGFASKGELDRFSGTLGFDHLYAVMIGGQLKLAGSIGGMITGMGNGYKFDTSNSNTYAAVLAGNGEATVWGRDPQGQGVDDFVKIAHTIALTANAADMAISTAQQTIQTTRVGANFAYAISGSSKLVNVISNTFKYAPYVGLFVTVGTGSYLSKTLNPETNQPYQSWAETGTDIGVNIATMYIGAKYGGWYGAGAAAFYIGVKTNVQYQINNGLNPGMIFIINKE